MSVLYHDKLTAKNFAKKYGARLPRFGRVLYINLPGPMGVHLIQKVSDNQYLIQHTTK